MGELSTIEWTDHTFNPWWGCTKVSPGCVHCYAETWSHRYGHNIWGPRAQRRTFSAEHWQAPLKWNRSAEQQGKRMRVFCASMADVFENNPSLVGERQKLWNIIQETPFLDWLLLTKRPENMVKLTPWEEWPANVWAMTSVENQDLALKRIPVLLDVPSKVRGLSVEPLLGPVDLSPWVDRLQWVIVGGESGPSARPLDPQWVLDIRNQCQSANVPFFFKQWGEWGLTTTLSEGKESTEMKRVGKKKAGRLLEGQTWDQIPTPSVDELFPVS